MPNIIERLPFVETDAAGVFGPAVATAAAWEAELGRIRNDANESGIDYWLQADADWLKSNPATGRVEWRDRWNGGFFGVSQASGVLPAVVDSDGRGAFQFVSSVNSIFFQPAGAKFNKPAFSMLFVASATATSYLVGTDDGGQQSPSLLLTGTTIQTRAGGDATMSASHGKVAGQKVLVGMTFDQERGTSLRANGKEVGRDATRKALAAQNNIRIGGTGTSATARLNGLLHMGLIFNVDISRPEHAGYLARAEALLMQRFSVAA